MTDNLRRMLELAGDVRPEHRELRDLTTRPAIATLPLSPAEYATLRAEWQRKAADAQQEIADSVRPRAFSTSEERAVWQVEEDQARGMRESEHRACNTAAVTLLRAHDVNSNRTSNRGRR